MLPRPCACQEGMFVLLSGVMARVSQEHLDARRRQILQGAAQCFGRAGFHGTSMQDVFEETGLSPGAVYRYFSGKEALITAIAHEVLDQCGEAFDEAARQPCPPLPDEILTNSLSRVSKLLLFPPALVVHVWAETFRDERLAALMGEIYGRLSASWTEIVRGYQRSGVMPADVPPEHVARTLLACGQGFLVQRALFGPLDFSVLRNGLRALMSMAVPPPAPATPATSAATSAAAEAAEPGVAAR